MRLYSSIIVWGGGALAILVPFLILMTVGWPGDVNSCIGKPVTVHGKVTYPDLHCYCEEFSVQEAIKGTPGVRQPTNTWSNLYALFTSMLVAVFIYVDRRDGMNINPMRSYSWWADCYVFVLQFLGLGSMWFHGAMKEWGGVTDQLSMFLYAGFLIVYTVRRLANFRWPWASFGALYVAIVAPATYITAEWSKSFGKASMVMIIVMVVAYLALEIWVGVRNKTFAQFSKDAPLPFILWCLAATSMLVATVCQVTSDNGGPLCNSNSAFQPHGLLWHTGAGAMALLLYFYWRLDTKTPGYDGSV